MATENVAPNSDITTEWTYDGAGGHYTGMDEPIATPAADGDIYTDDPANQERFGTVNPSFAGICTSIRVGVYGIAAGGTLTVRLFDGAAQIGSDKTIAVTGSWSTVYSASWTGLSYAAADLTNLAVEFEVTDYYTITLRTVTVEITYVTGPDNIGTMGGIADADIGEINDINWNLVEEVNDVS